MTKPIAIDIDANGRTVPTDFSWQLGIGNDHAYQVLRKDVCEHLKLAHDELGVKYVRFHGIFDDDMLCIQTLSDLPAYRVFPCADKITERSFRRVASVLDNVLSCGLKPFVELSFMPSALASGNKTGLAYKNNITMPKDLTAWASFIADFIRFVLDRYGAEQVRSWYFEVWNEPDLDIFFDGSQADYFALYDATARAIKSVDSALRVGGPSTSACRWISDFTEHCRKNDVPYDFITTHHYPGDAFGNAVTDAKVERMLAAAAACAQNGDDIGDALAKVFYDPETYAGRKKGALAALDKKARAEAGDKPLIITEWNCSATYSLPLHDQKYSAAFAVKSVMDAQRLTDGYMFWCCSDIFEETFDLGKPFHGSFGIVSVDGIPKPAFWAFKILSQLYRNRLDLPVTGDDVEYGVFTDGQKLQILLYAQDLDCEKREKHSVRITVNRKISGAKKQAIDDTHCNPKAEWIALGKPDILTPAQAEHIARASALRAEDIPFSAGADSSVISLEISTNDVVLLTVE